MTGVNDLTKLVPGFEFLQGLMKTASAGIPGMGQWVAPTLDPQELDKRIQELKTVQFWLDNNAKMLGATIQALEVQRMTLRTLQTMNLPLADLRDALRIKLPEAAAEDTATAPTARTAQTTQTAETAKAAPAAIDPMQWWGALTQQFSELAASAVKDSGGHAARSAADAAPVAARKAAGKRATPRKPR